VRSAPAAKEKGVETPPFIAYIWTRRCRSRARWVGWQVTFQGPISKEEARELIEVVTSQIQAEAVRWSSCKSAGPTDAACVGRAESHLRAFVLEDVCSGVPG
jgi:hypothetical protein